MTKFLTGFFSSILIVTIIGCGSLIGKNKGIYGKSSEKEDKSKANIEQIEKNITGVEIEKLTDIGAWSEGTGYVLDKVKDPPKEVAVAKQINERVQELANKPDFNKAKEVKKIIDQLVSEIKSEREKGEKSLKEKDEEIYAISLKVKALEYAKDIELNKYMKIASDTAKKADQYKETLQEMDSYFGFGAISYGIKKLVVRGAWVIGVGSLLYLLLRVFASANPVVGSIFSIFEMILSWFVRLIKGIAPKALEFAGHTATSIFEGYKSSFNKIVDTIELMKEREKANGGSKKYTIDELLDEVSKAMNEEDKNRVLDAKKELKWK